MTAQYIGLDLESGEFRDEAGGRIGDSQVKALHAAGNLDATGMVFRLINEFDFDREKLRKYYGEKGSESEQALHKQDKDVDHQSRQINHVGPNMIAALAASEAITIELADGVKLVIEKRILG